DFLVDVERDVPERRRRQLGVEQRLVLGIRELEEGKAATVADLEEAVAIGAVLAEQEVGLAPGRHERNAEHVLVERASLLEVLGDIGRVMQPAGQFRHRSSPVAAESSPVRFVRSLTKLRPGAIHPLRPSTSSLASPSSGGGTTLSSISPSKRTGKRTVRNVPRFPSPSITSLWCAASSPSTTSLEV